MQRDKLKYLYDIRVSILSIYEYLQDHQSFELYKGNKMLTRAVERELEIIGEAVNNLLRIDPEISIDHSRRIVNLRNWVIHSYDNVDQAIIWVVITRNIPELHTQVDKLIEKINDDNR
jgi:uncharacterized protein with HEPN domain